MPRDSSDHPLGPDYPCAWRLTGGAQIPEHNIVNASTLLPDAWFFMNNIVNASTLVPDTWFFMSLNLESPRGFPNLRAELTAKLEWKPGCDLVTMVTRNYHKYLLMTSLEKQAREGVWKEHLQKSTCGIDQKKTGLSFMDPAVQGLFPWYNPLLAGVGSRKSTSKIFSVLDSFGFS